MVDTELINEHEVYLNILESRGLKGITKNKPLWKLKLTDEEYQNLKQELIENSDRLDLYGIEAALCYAEWWRRDYRGNIPSKEDVAVGIGLGAGYGDPLYMAARIALEKRGYSFIHSLKGTEYFRTLLNQGGLPVNYIKNGNLGSFSRFLKGLVRELSLINYDWNDEDCSIIRQLNCISYLGKAFKNENIYDVAMQIAHAIIMDDNTLLPYDDTDASLSDLTKSLKREYTRAKKEKRVRPLSLHWKLSTSENGYGHLLVNMDVVKDLSSDSIPGLDISTCYSFDVFVSGTLVGKYVRKSINRDDEGEISNATYTRISVGINKDIVWNGEPVVEVKVRCDNDERIFLTIAGCYPPNFDEPQVFQMLDDNLFCQGKIDNSETNLAVFSSEWTGENDKSLHIGNLNLFCAEFSDNYVITNTKNQEERTLTNEFTPYSVEFSGNYIPWVEKSNFKLLSKIPAIHAFDKDKNPVQNIKKLYRVRTNFNGKWYNLNSSCVFPPGLVDLKVVFPDKHYAVETFYAIGNMSFDSSNEEAFSTEISCSCDAAMRPCIEKMSGADFETISPTKWKISRKRDSQKCPSLCSFRIYNQGNPTLRISVSIPFDGVMLTDVQGNIIPRGKIISFANLTYYNIICHSRYKKEIKVTYQSGRIEDQSRVKYLKSKVIDGLVSLSDYNDLIVRMFNLYGDNSFDRSSSVVLYVPGTEIYVRKFVLDSTIQDGKILVVDDTGENTAGFKYENDLYAFPVDEDVTVDDYSPVKLKNKKECGAENTFLFPESFTYKEVIVFSGPEARRRIVPKYFNRNVGEMDKETRASHSTDITRQWYDMLSKEDVLSGTHWRILCKAFDICSHYGLPFSTHNGLKAISRDPKLLSNFIICMWLNGLKEVLSLDVDRFEQEMIVALHWIPKYLWQESIETFLNSIPEPLKPMMSGKLQDFISLLQDLFNSTLSTDIASHFASYIVQGEIESGSPFSKSDINIFKTKIHGLSDTNKDLPLVEHELRGKYYPSQDMPGYYRVMIESAMCAAENTCNVQDCVDLFSYEGKEHARVVNFYRKYFKETYSEIFFRTIKIIKTNE